jgi:hypothetical protein
MALDANIIGALSGAKQEVDTDTKSAYAIAPQRRVSGTLAAINAEVVANVNGEAHTVIFLSGTGTFNATYNVQGSPDGVNFFDMVAYPLPQFCVGGTIPLAGQPIISEAVNAATVQRTLCLAVGGMQKIRIRLTAYTGGSGAVIINSDVGESASPYVRNQKAATLIVTATGAAGAAVTATLPAVAGLRHYIDRIDVTQFGTATAAGTATPVLVTTTNVPGAPVLTLGSDYLIGRALQQDLDFGASGMATTALNTATTVVCPATTNVLWRVTVAYRLGL